MKKITSLTKEQIARFPEFVQRWTKIGLDTNPADRQMAEEGIREAYRIANLPEPKQIIWCSSPIAALLTIAILKKCKASVGDSVWDSVRDSVRDSVGASVRASVWDSVGASVWDSVGASVWDSVWASVRDSVRDSVGASVWDSVGASVWDSVRDSVRDSVGASVWDSVGDIWQENNSWGQHDASWLSFHDFMREVVGLEGETAKLSGLWKIAKSANWWWAYREIVFVCDRPRVVALDEQGQLHRADSPAVEYPDGWGVYAWHGVRVPQQIIEHPETITAKQIQEETNAEVRRVMFERFGFERYVVESGATALHADRFGILYRVEMGDDEPLVMVSVLNSTPELDGSFKRYMIRVPPTMQTAHAAVAWTFGLSEREYQPNFES